MNSPNLKNLAKIGKLKKEQVSQSEFDGLVKSGRTRLADARTPGLSMESRFDLTYNASPRAGTRRAALAWLSIGESLSGVSASIRNPGPSPGTLADIGTLP